MTRIEPGPQQHAHEPETLLAIAVVERCVREMRCRNPERRDAAIADYLAGGLEYWIEAAAVEVDVADGLRRRLEELAQRHLLAG